MENKKKFDGFAVASFVMSLIAVIMFFLILLPRSYETYNPYRDSISDIVFVGYVIYSLILVTSFVFGIIALVRIDKTVSLRGKMLAIFGIIISVIQFPIPAIIDLLKNGIQM